METSTITTGMRDVLIAHLDGRKIPVVLHATDGAVRNRMVQTQALLKRGLLRASTEQTRPHFTIITDKGRHALAKLLADYADAIVRARAMRGLPPWRRFAAAPVGKAALETLEKWREEPDLPLAP